MKKVVVMGGGTGTFPVIQALKHLGVELTSIIAVSDSGGSTGRIRDEFGFQPVGDLRQALAALAENEGEEWIRKLLLYRFEKGNGLQGHNLGNLMLTALQDMTGDTTQALEIAAKIFRLDGHVIPVTADNVQLEITYQDGSVSVGEHTLDHTGTEPKKIKSVRLIPSARINPIAENALRAADDIIIGPGDFYASLMPTLIPEGMKKVLQETSAKIIYIVNLMTRFTQTHDMSAADHLRGIEAVIDRPVDVVLLNSQRIPAEITQLYAREKEFPVTDDLGNDGRIIRSDVISDQPTEKKPADMVPRSLLRHDMNKLHQVLAQII